MPCFQLRLVAATLALLPLAGSAPCLAQAVPQSFEDVSRQAENAIDDRPADAAVLYQQALAMRPQWAEGWLYLGATLLKLGRFDESRHALKTGTQLNPGKGTAWAYLGMAEYELSDYREALDDIRKGESLGLAERPAFVAAARYRGALAALHFSDHTQAIEQLRPLVRAGNDSLPVIEALGISALFMNTLPNALSGRERLLVDCAGRAAWAFIAERGDQAQVLFAKLVAQFPAEPGVQYMYGVFLLDRDAGAAAKAFHEELGVTPSHTLARVQLALLALQDGDSKTAVAFAAEATQLEPDNPLCQVTFGRALLNSGRIVPAIAALEKGKALAPDLARTHFYLQQAYQRAGRTAEARKEKAEFDRLRALQEPVTVGAP